MPVEKFIELATHEGKRVLDVIFRNASEAVTVQDQSGNVIYANDLAAELTGFASGQEMAGTQSPVHSVLGQLEMIDRKGDPISVEALPGRRVLAGEPFAEQIVGYRRPGSQQAQWSLVRASAVKNNAGEVLLAINFFHDITEQVRREDRRRLLSMASQALGSSLESKQNLKALADVIVPELGGWFAVHLLEGDQLVLAAAAYPDSDDAVAFVETSGTESVSLSGSGFQAQVIASGSPQFVRRITPEMLTEAKTRAGAEIAEFIRRLQIDSVICVPLQIGDRTIGTMTVARNLPDSAFDDSDLDLLVSIAVRAASSLENARIYEEEHEIAEVLQRGLLAPTLVEIPGISLGARYQPLATIAQVGGDFYDILPLPGDRWAVLVGDIAGKGVHAATGVGLARYTARAVVAIDPRPSTVVEQLNGALRQEQPERMCTLAYLTLERSHDGWDLGVTLAGHPPPVLLRAGEVSFLGTPCPPLGVLPELEVHHDRYALGPGDYVIVYTDGYDVQGLAPPESVELALAGNSYGSVEELLDRMMAFLENDSTDVIDDVVLLALRVAP
jgi:PAS domain S-box-containing protein